MSKRMNTISVKTLRLPSKGSILSIFLVLVIVSSFLSAISFSTSSISYYQAFGQSSAREIIEEVKKEEEDEDSSEDDQDDDANQADGNNGDESDGNDGGGGGGNSDDNS